MSLDCFFGTGDSFCCCLLDWTGILGGDSSLELDLTHSLPLDRYPSFFYPILLYHSLVDCKRPVNCGSTVVTTVGRTSSTRRGLSGASSNCPFKEMDLSLTPIRLIFVVPFSTAFKHLPFQGASHAKVRSQLSQRISWLLGLTSLHSSRASFSKRLVLRRNSPTVPSGNVFVSSSSRTARSGLITLAILDFFSNSQSFIHCKGSPLSSPTTVA